MSNPEESIFDDELWIESLGESHVYKEFFRVTVEEIKTVDTPPLTVFLAIIRVHSTNAVLRRLLAMKHETAFMAGRVYVDHLISVPGVLTSLKRSPGGNKQ